MVGITVAGRTLLRPLYKRVAGGAAQERKMGGMGKALVPMEAQQPVNQRQGGGFLCSHSALPCHCHARACPPSPASPPLLPAETGDTTIFNALTLLVVLGTSLITQVAGLSLALGAFLAGLLLAETEYHLQVESDIGPYKGLLMGLFFMTGALAAGGGAGVVVGGWVWW
jgi:hypothetical protein